MLLAEHEARIFAKMFTGNVREVNMSISRRKFMESAIGASTVGIMGQKALLPLAAGAKVEGYRPNLLPSRKEVWDWQDWMAKLGPKYTGNQAHTTFVEL